MAQKKSIAIIGATNKRGEEVATQLSHCNCDLLLVSNDKMALDHLSEKMKASDSEGEIRFIECVKEGCWEADIIILAVPHAEEKKIAGVMKEVATQKIVALFSNQAKACDELGGILPYSRLVRLSGDVRSKEITIGGVDATANEEISEIFIQAGYHCDIEKQEFKN